MGAVLLIILIVIGIILFSSMTGSNRTTDRREKEKIINIKGGNIKKNIRIGIIIFAGLIILITLLNSIVVVPAGHRYVVFNVFKGVLDKELDEGIHILLPYINKTTSYDIRVQEYTMSSVKGEGRRDQPDSLWAPTNEGLQVGIDLTVLYRIDPENVAVLHRSIGPIYESKIIRPAIRSVVRHNISDHSVLEVYSKSRKKIEQKIYQDLLEQMKPDNIIVESVKLRDVVFTDRFAESIEKKQIAEQEMERWEFIKRQREKEADARIIEAKGKAEAMEIISREIKKNPDIIKYNYVEKLSDNIKVIVTDQSTIMDLKGILEEYEKK